MRLKPGVDLSNLTPQALVILIAAQHLRPDLVVTSGRDGVHKPGSKHYDGGTVVAHQPACLVQGKRATMRPAASPTKRYFRMRRMRHVHGY